MAELSADDDSRLSALVDAVLAAADPNHVLLDMLGSLEREQNPALACAVFEQTVWRVHISNYWVLAIVSGCYRALNRQDAAFLTAAMAERMEPRSSGSFHMCQTMFDFFRARGRDAAALDVFYSHAERFPHHPVAPAWQVLPIAQNAGRNLAALFGDAQPTADSMLRRSFVVIEQSAWPGWSCAVYGGRRAAALDVLAAGRPIPAVYVAYLENAELLISHHAVVVLDAEGGLHADLSIHDFPMLLKRHIDSLAAEPGAVEQIQVNAAVMIADRFPATNLCHFLFDHVTRLHLYERAGVDISAVTVVDATNVADFQRTILSRVGVTRFLSTDRVARVRVGRLWVSSNCRELRHPAHLGSDWAIAYLRGRLVPTWPTGGRRLYVSRSDATKRRVTNEDEVVALLSQHGFDVIVPSALAYDSQVAAFAGASHVVGPHGAGLANIVFCRPGTRVLEAFHPRYGTAAYANLARNGRLDYAALVARDGHSSEAEFNDPTDASGPGSVHLDRDIYIDLADIQRWLSDGGESNR